MLLKDSDRSFKQGHGSHGNLSLKIGCETELNWVKRRLNYERKGEPIECLHKGYGQGQTHMFKPAEKDREISEEEADVLKKWGVPDNPLVITNVVSLTLLQPMICPLNFSFLFVAPQLNFVSRGYQITNGVDGKFNNNAFMCLEDSQRSLPPNLRTKNIFLNSLRSVTTTRVANNTAGGIRDFRYLEESFSLVKNNSVFDEEDIIALFHVADQQGKVLLLLPQLTKHLQVIPGSFVLCEVDFGFFSNNIGRIVFYADLTQNPQLYFYSRAIVQQFVLFGEFWLVSKFDVEEPEIGDFLHIAILRLYEQDVNNQVIFNRDLRVLNFFAY